MEGEQLVNLVVLGVPDINDQQYSAALHRSITFADRQSPWWCIRKGGHYSLVNNVQGDIIHGGTVFTLVSFPDPERARAKKGSGDIATCCLTFEGRDHDDVISRF